MGDDAITVGEFKRQIAALDDDDELVLPGGLTFCGIKRWGENEYLIEVNEPAAYLSDQFKKRNPQVKIAFISVDDIGWDESGVVGGPVNVEVT